MGQMLSIVKEHVMDRKWVVILLGGLTGLLGLLIINMIGSLDLEGLQSLIEVFPPEMLDFFGGDLAFTNPYGFLNIEVLSFLWLYAGIYLVFAASSILAQEVDKKTIELSLSKPITRTKYLASKIISLYLVIIFMMIIAFLIFSAGIVNSQAFIDEGFYWDRVWGTCLIAILFLSGLSMIAFFGSTIFLNSKMAMLIGIIGLFIMFFINGFYTYLEELEDLKYFTVFYYYNPLEYLVNADMDIFIRDILVLSSINVVLIVGSIIVFNKKDIPN